MNGFNEPDLRQRDRTVLRFVGRTNIWVRTVLCTLARHGVALRRDEPERARQILDAMGPWPFYKGGQFLFDLLEWEDLMLDGDPPPPLSRAELAGLLDMPTRWLTATVAAVDSQTPGPLRQIGANLPIRWLAATAQSTLQGVVRDLAGMLAPPSTAPAGDDRPADDALPPLQSGFYLYEDVVLGLFDLVGARLPGSAEFDDTVLPADPADQDPGHEQKGTAMTTSQKPAETTSTFSTEVFPIEETFRVLDVKGLNHDWTLRGDATLTGDNGLQLTPNAQNKAGTALLNVAFPSDKGVSIEFDFYCAGGNGDGFAVYLIDGAHDTEVGGYGAGLGYGRGPYGDGNGVSKGWLGLGFDKWGNFSRTWAGPSPEDVRSPDRIVLRGSGDRTSGFNYIDGVAVDGGLNAVWEDEVHVQVVIVNAVVSVFLTRAGRATTVFDGLDLKLVQGQAAMPGTLKIGLSASTGGETSWHYLRNLEITMPAEMPVTVDGADEVPAGSQVSYTITVRNDGPNDVPDATITGTLDPALSNVSVTVSRADGGASATEQGSTDAGTFRQPLNLPVGGSATITVTGTTARDATGTVTCTATVESEKYSNTAKNRSDSHSTRLTEHIPQDNLRVCQHAAVSIKPGAEGHIAISVDNPDNNEVELQKAELVLDAPTGFEWTGSITFTYYNASGQSEGSGAVALKPTLENNNQRLRLTGLQKFRAAEGYVLTYALGVRARSDAKPGRYTDGKAVVADSLPLRLTATVPGAAEQQSFSNNDTAMPVVQPAVLEIKQGESGFMAVTVGYQQDAEQDLSTLDQQFRAPTGLRWNGFVSYSYYSGGQTTQGSSGAIKHQVTGNGSILKITGMPELKATKGLYLTYVLGLTANEDAQPGQHDDGEATIGNARPLVLHATVMDKNESSKCNR